MNPVSQFADVSTTTSASAHWRDGVGVTGAVVPFVIVAFWSLANLWVVGWSRSQAWMLLVLALAMTALGARMRSGRVAPPRRD